MKLAEALQERASLARRIEQLRDRLEDSAVMQEGDAPSEDPESLFEELNRCIARSEELMTHINLTNASLRIGLETMTALLARRECLRMKISVLQSASQSARTTVRRGTRSEIRIVSAIDVPALHKRIDQLSQQLRALDVTIQSANWTHDLM